MTTISPETVGYVPLTRGPHDGRVADLARMLDALEVQMRNVAERALTALPDDAEYEWLDTLAVLADGIQAVSGLIRAGRNGALLLFPWVR